MLSPSVSGSHPLQLWEGLSLSHPPVLARSDEARDVGLPSLLGVEELRPLGEVGAGQQRHHLPGTECVIVMSLPIATVAAERVHTASIGDITHRVKLP